MPQQMVIDSLKFARDRGQLEGTLPVSGLSRIHDLLTEVSGQVVFRLQGGEGRLGRKQLVLEVDGELPLRCQRCLERIDHPLRIVSTLELIGSEAELSQEDLEDDTRDFLTAQKDLDVAVLVEDEVILALPPVPRHEHCAPLGGQPAVQKEDSPFAALAALKGRAPKV